MFRNAANSGGGGKKGGGKSSKATAAKTAARFAVKTGTRKVTGVVRKKGSQRDF
jgi:hypothetical protein